MTKPRRQLVAQLIARDGDVDALRAQLAALQSRPSDEEVVVGPADVVGALREYVQGSRSAEAVSRWAEALEFVDEVVTEDDRTAEVLFELANPLLHVSLTPVRAIELVRTLEASESRPRSAASHEPE